ncbi:NLE domain protein [Cooperia oncophora]
MGEQLEEFENSGDVRHVQVSFFSEEQTIADIPSAIFDIPVSATCENLNALVNKTISGSNDKWSERRFEFLVGETFIRSSLAEFIEEYNVETETVIKIECVLGKETPKPLHDIQAPDWVSSVIVSNSHFFSTTYSGEIIIIDKKGKTVLENNRDKGSAFKCSVLLASGSDPKKLEGSQLVVGGEKRMLTLLEAEDGALLPKVCSVHYSFFVYYFCMQLHGAIASCLLLE